MNRLQVREGRVNRVCDFLQLAMEPEARLDCLRRHPHDSEYLNLEGEILDVGHAVISEGSNDRSLAKVKFLQYNVIADQNEQTTSSKMTQP